jgi:hypothetical protein
MADLVKSARASMDASTGMFAPQKTGDLYAGEALGACVPCYIKSADGKVYQSNGTALGEAAKFDGFTPTSHGIGEPVALFGVGARFRYGTGLTIGADLHQRHGRQPLRHRDHRRRPRHRPGHDRHGHRGHQELRPGVEEN